MKTSRGIFFIILLSFALILTSCHSASTDTQPMDNGVRYRNAWYVADDGWVYQFDNQYVKTEYDYGSQATDHWPFSFKGVNLRYRYNEDFTLQLEDRAPGDRVLANICELGSSDSQVERKDMDKIADILDYDLAGTRLTTDEMLALTTEDLDFEYLDPEIFLEVMHECLKKEPGTIGPYPSIPSHGLFTEPIYLAGYKFQVGLLGGFGTIDVLIFDVLYRTGDGLTDYVQLYDLVRDGEASEEQIRLLQILQELETGITQNNDHQYMIDTYGNAVVAGVDLSRLYLMVENIVNLEYSEYIVLPQ